MSLLNEIKDKGAAVAWSPSPAQPNLLALGSKEGAGVGFDNYGGELELYRMELSSSDRSAAPCGSVKTNTRFASLAWSRMSKHSSRFPAGIIAGGMGDGTVNVWDPAKIINNEGPQSQLSRVQKHKAAVRGLQFNPHRDSSSLLASGGSDSEVYIMSLERPDAPNIFSPGDAAKHTAEVTSVAWNTQVAHILATSSVNGQCMVWDLKQKRPWCTLTDPYKTSVSCIAWNPTEGLNIVTASEDDQKPVIRLWDLRSSTSTPLAELQGHTAGILSLSWCTHDTGLLLSCGKDNKTLLWDLYTGKPIYELPSSSVEQPNGGSFFGGAGGGQRRYDVQWSPHIPAVVSTCSFDRKVQVFGMVGAGSGTSLRAPKWLRRPVGVSWAFGGKLVTFNSGNQSLAPGAPSTQAISKVVRIHRFASEPQVVEKAERFETAINNKDFKAFCRQRADQAVDEHEKNTWSFMQILFEQDARQQLLLHLGFDGAKVAEEASKYSSKTGLGVVGDTRSADVKAEEVFGGNQDASAIFGSGDTHQEAETNDVTNAVKEKLTLAKEEDGVSLSKGANSPTHHGPVPTYSKESEDIIKRALLVGNFEAAVECCLHFNQLADALLLATCGGPELWAKTQEAYFSRQQRPFIRIVSAIIRSELIQLVQASDLTKWKETLAILSTYGKSEEFPSLCDALAARLENEKKDIPSATLCYMCAVNVDKTLGIWIKEASCASQAVGYVAAMQDLIEKVSIFRQALEQGEQDLGGDISRYFGNYALLLAAQGRLDLAQRYAIFQDENCSILRDRIFQSSPTPGVAPPPTPWQSTQTAAAPSGASAMQQGSYQQAQGAGFTGTAARTPAYSAPQGGGVGYSAPSRFPASTNIPDPSSYGSATFSQPPQPGPYPGGMTGATSYASPYPTPQPAGLYPPSAQPQHGGATLPSPASYGAQPAQNYQSPAPGGAYAVPSSLPSGVYNPGSVSAAIPAVQPPSFGGSYAGALAPQPPPGATPLEAAKAAATSGRVPLSVPDIKEAKKDGFVSSVGNKDLARKYGNQVPASILAPAQEPSTPQPAAPALPPGDTSNVSQENLVVVNALKSLFALIMASDLNPAEKRQIQEIEKGRDVLFTKLNSNGVSPDVCQKLRDLSAAITGRDFRSALNIVTALTSTDWNEHKDWLRGIKFLIQLGQRKA